MKKLSVGNKTKLQHNNNESNESVCSICCSAIDTGKSVLQCGHEYHDHCMNRLYNHNHQSCPMCRIEIVETPIKIYEENKRKYEILKEVLCESNKMYKHLLPKQKVLVQNIINALEENNKNDHVNSIVLLGEIYTNNIIIKKDVRKGISYYKRSIKLVDDNKYSECDLNYILCEAAKLYYLNGEKENALNLLKRARSNKCQEAIYIFARIYMDEFLNNKNKLSKEQKEKIENRIYQSYYFLSEQGYTKSFVELGQCYTMGIGTEENCIKAFEWYMRAAKKDCIKGKYLSALSYYNGTGVERSVESTKLWLSDPVKKNYCNSVKILRSIDNTNDYVV